MNATSWVMAAHIASLGLWSAALLILAGFYAAIPPHEDRADWHRHALMCRYVFVMLGSPAALIAIISGSALVALRGVDGSWLLAKLALVAAMGIYHVYCGHLLHAQEREELPAMPGWKIPLLLLTPVGLISFILVLVLAKPDVVLEHQITPKPAGNRDEARAQQRQIKPTAMNGIERVFNPG